MKVCLKDNAKQCELYFLKTAYQEPKNKENPENNMINPVSYLRLH